MIQKETIKKMILELLREDEEFRLALIGALVESFTTRDETNRLLDEIKSLREDFNRRMEEMRAEFQAQMTQLREDFNRRMEEMRAEFQERFIIFDKKLDALGARWGIMSEEAFRNGLRHLLEERFKVRVERWVFFDSEGYVFGHPSVVDADVVIHDREHILVEIKSSVSKGDVAVFKRIGDLYERVKKLRPKLMIISPWVDEGAKELAQIFGIDIESVESIVKSKLRF